MYDYLNRPVIFPISSISMFRPGRAPYWTPGVRIVALLLRVLFSPAIVFDPGNCDSIGKFRASLLADDGDLDVLADVVMAVTCGGADAGITPRF